MKVYTVHLRKNEQDGINNIVLVLEGFNWSAFILSLIWALWHHMWWVSMGLVCLLVTVIGLIYSLGMDAFAVNFYGMGMAVLFGLVANDLRRWSLSRVGFIEAAVVFGDNQDAALARFLDNSPDISRGIY